MRFSTLAAATLATVATAADSTCDKYTKALLKDNTAKNQATLLTLLVNTVVIGNYTMPNTGVKVDGILAKGTGDYEGVNLLPYFDGTLKSSNRDNKATCVNFLDDGGAAPLMKNKPANGMDSNQYFLLTHLYQFFGALLGCSQQGMSGFDAYGGDQSMYKVHKFMNLGPKEMGWFIQNVANAALSFGVSKDDVGAVGMALTNAFNMKCSAPAAIVGKTPEPQAICIASGCTEAKNASCSSYDAAMAPSKCSGSGSNGTMPTGSGTMMPTGTSSPTGSSVPTNAAALQGVSVAALLAGVAAFAL